jgi:hypothetical protein
MGSFEKMVYGILLFSMSLVVLTSYHIKSANIYGVSVGTELSTLGDDSQLATINDTFDSMNTQLQSDPTGSESSGGLPDVAGILFQSGVSTVKLLSNSINFMQQALVTSARSLGISESEVYIFLLVIITVFVVFAIIKVVTGRRDL